MAKKLVGPPIKTNTKPPTKTKLSLNDLNPHIEKIATAVEDIHADIKYGNPAMIKRYLDEIEEATKEAKRLFAKIVG